MKFDPEEPEPPLPKKPEKKEEVLSEGSKIHAKTKPKIVIKPLKAKKELTKDEKRK